MRRNSREDVRACCPHCSISWWEVQRRNAATRNKPGSRRLAASSACASFNSQCGVNQDAKTCQTAALMDFQTSHWKRQGGFLDTFLQLPPRFIMQLILIILPSVNRLMQQTASSLLHSPLLPSFFPLFLFDTSFLPPSSYFLFLFYSTSPLYLSLMLLVSSFHHCFSFYLNTFFHF